MQPALWIPYSPPGVHLALMAGVLAAAYVTTSLKDPSLCQAAGRVYKDLYYKEYGHFRDMAALFYSSNRTLDSYFWEARRLLGGHGHLSPRQAFIHAVAGQPPRGYERAVLEHGEAPPEFVHSVHLVEAEREARRAHLAAVLNQTELRHTRLYQSVPQSGPRRPCGASTCTGRRRVRVGACPAHGWISRRHTVQRSGSEAGVPHRWGHLNRYTAG